MKYDLRHAYTMRVNFINHARLAASADNGPGIEHMLIKTLDGKVLFEIDDVVVGYDFSNRCLDRAVFEGAKWEGVHFAQSSLKEAVFNNCDFYWGDFFEADLSDAKFVKTDLRGADLSDARCVGTSFTDCNLGIDNLRGGTILNGANFANAKFVNTELIGAIYDVRTMFSAGFEPSVYGMRMQSE